MNVFVAYIAGFISGMVFLILISVLASGGKDW